MGKDLLRERLMTDAAYVDEAAAWAKRLTQAEARGPGDMENAWHRLEHRYGVPWRAFWSLRYRRPREIAASIYLRLQAAYVAECERQMRLHQHELEITRTKAGADHPAVVAAEALAGENTDASTVNNRVKLNTNV
jgi:hypothetical protein